MTSVYLSGSKHSNPQEFSYVYAALQNMLTCPIKTYEGGMFEKTAPDNSDYLIIIPPVNADSDKESIYLGRGQYDMVDRALDNNQKAIIFFNNKFYFIQKVVYIGDAWQKSYGIAFTNKDECPLNSIFLKKKKEIKDVSYSNITLLPAYILFPNRFK